MRKSRFTEEQILGILKEGEAGIDVATLLRKHGISRATYYQWRSKYVGTSASELKEIKALEAENAKSLTPGSGSSEKPSDEDEGTT